MPAPSSSPAHNPPSSPWWRRLTSPVAAGIVLVLFWGVLLASLRDKSSTVDEPGHAASGYAYWKYNDYRLDPENGNFPQRVFGLAYLGDSVRPPVLDSPRWREAETLRLAYDWFNNPDNDLRAMLARGRALSGLFAVALGLVIWFWARQLFGPAGGMLSLILYVLNPTVLANGALMTSDTASALFFLLATWRAWAVLQRCTVRNVLLSAAATGLLFITKMSGVLIIPIVGVLIAFRLREHRALPVAGGKEIASRGVQLGIFGAVAVCHALVAIGLVWLSFGFRYSAFSAAHAPGHFILPWESVLDKPDHLALLDRLALDAPARERVLEVLKKNDAQQPGWSYRAYDALATISETILTPQQARQLAESRAEPSPSPILDLLELAREQRFLPEAYLYGYAFVWKLSQKRTAFFNGEIRDTGWRTFFPYTFLVKTPLALLGVFGLAVTGYALQRRTQEAAARTALRNALLPLWLLMGVYGTTVIFSHLNIGHRHLLPIYPPLFILGGAAGAWLVRAGRKSTPDNGGKVSGAARFSGLAVAGLVGVLAIESAVRFPNYLPYFNGIISSSQAYHHLIDSSLDWGQDLPALATYIAGRRPQGPLYLAYFGSDNPRRYGVQARLVHTFPLFAKQDSPPLLFVSGAPPDRNDPRVAVALRSEPDYDPDVIFSIRDGGNPGAVLIKRAASLRLTGGTYFISASLMPPVFLPQASGFWSTAHEINYRQLRETARHLLSDDLATRVAALESVSLADCLRTMEMFEEYRFARLSAALRKRAPDGQINHTILVYHLTDADVTQLLDGPPP